MVFANLNVILLVVALVIVVLAIIFGGVYCLNRVADRNAG
jgi:hypothetical protein